MAGPAPTDVSIFYRRDGFDPGPELAVAQRERPVTRVQDFWLYEDGEYWMVTRHADVRRVLGDSDTFGMHDPDRPPILADELINMDPPEHTRLRRVLTPGFTVRRIRQLEPRIQRIVADRLDEMESRGAPADLVADFALPIPALVICELLGVPGDDRAGFQRRGEMILDMALPLDERLTARRHSHEYMTELVASKRKHPEDDLISGVIREHGDSVTDEELVGVGDLMMFAGHETTSNMLGLGTLLLLGYPDQADAVRAMGHDDPMLDRAIEELMRYLSVVATPLARIARRDTELGGVLIREGESVVCQLPIANRDAAMGADLDTFDITREPTSHVAFGHGIHHCIGAPLARMEMRMAYPALLRRFPALRATLPADRIPYNAHSAIYGLASLPVEW